MRILPDAIHHHNLSSKVCHYLIFPVVLLGASFSIAQAKAIYDGSSLMQLSLISISGGPLDDLIITGIAEIFDSDIIQEGMATASVDSTVSPETEIDLAAGDALIQQTRAYGDAAAGSADSFVFTDGLVILQNLSVNNTYTIRFEFDYSLNVIAIADNLIREFAFATAVVRLMGQQADSVLIDELLEVATDDADSDNQPINQTIAFDVILEAGDEEILTLLADAEGGALAAIDIPNNAILFALGLAVLGQRRSLWFGKSLR